MASLTRVHYLSKKEESHVVVVVSTGVTQRRVRAASHIDVCTELYQTFNSLNEEFRKYYNVNCYIYYY